MIHNLLSHKCIYVLIMYCDWADEQNDYRKDENNLEVMRDIYIGKMLPCRRLLSLYYGYGVRTDEVNNDYYISKLKTDEIKNK